MAHTNEEGAALVAALRHFGADAGGDSAVYLGILKQDGPARDAQILSIVQSFRVAQQVRLDTFDADTASRKAALIADLGVLDALLVNLVAASDGVII